MGVTVIDRTNHHLFQPLLYQVASAVLSPEDIAIPIRAVLRRQARTRVLLGEVTRVDLDRRTVQLAQEATPVPYDYLILATGTRHAYFGHSDWEPLAPGLKTLSDALRMRRRILEAYEAAVRSRALGGEARGPAFVIVGGGPTGVELAGAVVSMVRHSLARDRLGVDPDRTRVVLAEAGPRILASFSPVLSAYAAQYLGRLGVEVRVDCRVTQIAADHVQLADERIAGAVVLWAAGNEASPLGRQLGATDAHGRVQVLPDLSVHGHREVFVAGDLAAAADPWGIVLPQVAPVATQQGRHAAAMVVRRVQGRPTVPFRFHNRGQMATLGRSAAVAQIGRARITGPMGWLIWLLVHITALIGFQNRILVLVRWAAAYWADQPGARILFETADGDPRGGPSS